MIPVNEPLVTDRDLAYVTDAVRSGWISSAGTYLDRFESVWAEYCGHRHGVAVVNGTAALEAAIGALRLGPGDEVIMPSFTIISCALAVVEAGAVPVLVDADPETWCMDVTQVAAKITPRTRAIMPVHMYGHPVDMDPLLDLAEKHGLTIVEDAAEAHGARYLSRRGGTERWLICGGMGALSCFSFYANKLITTGEGGMVITSDAALAERLRSLRNLCFQPRQRFVHDELGHNWRMTNVQAAMGLSQAERIDEIVAFKRWAAAEYTRRLSGIPGLALPVERDWAESVFWMYGLVLDESTGFDANSFAAALKAKGVDTRPFFCGMHAQPVLRARGLFAGESYPVTDRLYRQGLYLPSGMTLTEDQIDAVCVAVRQILAANA